MDVENNGCDAGQVKYEDSCLICEPGSVNKYPYVLLILQFNPLLNKYVLSYLCMDLTILHKFHRVGRFKSSACIIDAAGGSAFL